MEHIATASGTRSSTSLKRKRIDERYVAAVQKLGAGKTTTPRNSRKELQSSTRDVVLQQIKSIPVVDLTEDDPTPPAKVKPAKRKRVEIASSATELDGEMSPKKRKSLKTHEEKRLARFRDKAPQKYWDYYERANTQRMFALDRRRQNADDCPHGTPDCPSETVDLAGSTGNVYTINISHVPTCTCPDFQKGNKQCKHIIYVLVKVLKAPTKLSYQLAFLSSELREIFEHAGPLPIEQVSEEDKDGKRRPVEGDCPICCCDLEDKAEEVVWCKAACGNNLHKSCFNQWAASRRGQKVTCPYCRTAWSEGEDLKTLSKKGRVGNEGYINIASELGLSGRRDYSSYPSYWVRRQARDGLLGDGDFFEDEGY